MSSSKPYIGCKIGLISKAQNRYEGILYTIDKVNSTVVLAKVRCFGTEGRPTDRPTPPKDDVYEYITFRGSDIKDITLCEPPRAHHGLPPDPAIVQSASVGSQGVYSTFGPFSPLRMPAYNQLAANSLLNQQYAAALGLGSVVPGLPVRRAPMVEKASQTLHADRLRSSGAFAASQEPVQQWERRPQRPRRESPQYRRGTRANRNVLLFQVKSGPGAPIDQQDTRPQHFDNRPPPRRQGARRNRNRSRGQLMVAQVPSAVLKFDTDFDFDSSNAQFIKEELEREVQDRIKDGNPEVDEKEKEELPLTPKENNFGHKCYYDKAKSFFDNISSDNKFRLTWAEERKRNLETFGVPGRFLRGQGFRGGYAGRGGRGAARTDSPHRTRTAVEV
ncbi:lsm14b [Pungitius sinensis]